MDKKKIQKYFIGAGITTVIVAILTIIVFTLYTAGGYVLSGMKVVTHEILSYVLARSHIQDKDVIPEKYKIDQNATIEERAMALSKTLHSYRLAFKSLEIMDDAADILEKSELNIKERQKKARELKSEIQRVQGSYKEYESVIKAVQQDLSTVLERAKKESFWPNILQSLFFTLFGLGAGELIHFIMRKRSV